MSTDSENTPDFSELSLAQVSDLVAARPELLALAKREKGGMALDGLLAARPEFADRCGRGKATHAGRRAPRPKVLSRVKDDSMNSLVALIEADMVPIPGQDYALGKFEVVQALWEAVMGSNPSKFKGKARPVESITWDECQKFLDRLNALPDVKALGRPFRLPTAKEWVHACLAGAKKDGYCRLADGTDINRKMLNRVAWIDDEQSGGWRPRPVGLKESNAFGLFDMIGSVLEWTATPADGGRYYVCGPTTGAGSYKATWEGSAVPDTREKVIGFRLAR